MRRKFTKTIYLFQIIRKIILLEISISYSESNIEIDTILEYIIKLKVKQIMSRDDFIQEMIYKYVIRGSLNQ